MVNQSEFAALLEEFKKLNARMDKTEERLQRRDEDATAYEDVLAKLQRILNSHEANPHSFGPKKHDDIKLQDLPNFDGKGDPETYLDWERRLEHLFDHKGLSDVTRFSYAILKFTKNASLWFESLQTRRVREDKTKLNSWIALKAKLLEEYISEFERLYLACDLRDEEEQKTARFVVGLNLLIRNKLELQQFDTFDEACNLACKIERQHRDGRFRGFKGYPTHVQDSPSSSLTTSDDSELIKKKEEDIKKELAVKQEKLTAGQKNMKKVVCFKCHGQGHLAKDCTSNVLISLDEHYAYISSLIAARDGPQANTSTDEDAMEIVHNPNSWHGIPMYGPEGEHSNCLILQRALMSTQINGDEHEQRDKLFKTTCLVNGKHYSLIVDSGSCTNVVATSMIKDANLPTRAHPKPYKLSWLNEDGSLWVRKQALLSFRIGGYQDQFWCDVLPMSACSILLGRPWQYDRDVLHHGKTNIYTVLMNGARYGLVPSKPKKPAQDEPTSPPLDSTTASNGHVCFSSCRNEILDCAQDKRERREKALQLRRGSNLQEGDYVWLTLNAQTLHLNHKNDEPLDEGPFQITKQIGYETFKVLLGDNVCATLSSSDLVPCLPDDET